MASAAVSNQSYDIFSAIDTFRVEDLGEEAALVSRTRRRNTVIIDGVERFRIHYVGRLGKRGFGSYEFNEPNGICLTKKKNIIVTDTNRSLVIVFDSQGKQVHKIRSLTYPNKVAICPKTNNVVITERSPNNQVKVFTQNGKLLNEFGKDVLKNPRGLAIDSQGNIFVLESKDMRVLIFNEHGKPLHTLVDPKVKFPNDIALHNKEIYVSDNEGHCILVYNYEGKHVDSIGRDVVKHPVGVKISSRGEIVVGDNHNSFKITIFDRNNNVLIAFESIPKLSSCLDIALSPENLLYVSSKDNNVYLYDLSELWPPGQKFKQEERVAPKVGNRREINFDYRRPILGGGGESNVWGCDSPASNLWNSTTSLTQGDIFSSPLMNAYGSYKSPEEPLSPLSFLASDKVQAGLNGNYNQLFGGYNNNNGGYQFNESYGTQTGYGLNGFNGCHSANDDIETRLALLVQQIALGSANNSIFI